MYFIIHGPHYKTIRSPCTLYDLYTFLANLVNCFSKYNADSYELISFYWNRNTGQCISCWNLKPSLQNFKKIYRTSFAGSLGVNWISYNRTILYREGIAFPKLSNNLKKYNFKIMSKRNFTYLQWVHLKIYSLTKNIVIYHIYNLFTITYAYDLTLYYDFVLTFSIEKCAIYQRISYFSTMS